MLDTKGITLREVEHRYPSAVQLLGYDAVLDVDHFRKPKVISTFEMCVNIILTLLMMKPGQYPSIPELGIDIEQYLMEYSDDEEIPSTILAKLKDQCNRLELTGMTIDVYFDRTDVSRNDLCVEITGTEYITNHVEAPKVIIGISYDKLNRIFVRKNILKTGVD